MQRKYLSTKVAQSLGLSEATIRKRTDLPVLEVLPDGTRLYDADKIDLLRLAKAMKAGDSLLGLSQAALIEKFAERIERCNEQDRDALLQVSPIILQGASETDRRRLAVAMAKAITRGPNLLGQTFGDHVEKLERAGNVSK
jgi:hypothetical protein